MAITNEKNFDFRSSIHYLAAIASMGVYGGQVCPMVETLNIRDWVLLLTLIFGLIFVIRVFSLGFILKNIRHRHKSLGQFCIDFTWFTLAGIFIAGINKYMYGFPGIESGLKMILGTAALGFFMATDLAMARERLLARELETMNHSFSVGPHYFPMTLKFGIVSTIAAVSVAAIILLVVLKDLGWMMDVDTIDPQAARISVIKEILFVTLIFLAHIFNLIFSYAKNLNLAVDRENSALIRVSQGNLDTRITVSSHDEFGVMAQYTNEMIAMLRKTNRDIQQTRDATIIALAGLAETRDNETGDHILRTQNYVRALAVHLRHHPRFSAYLDEDTIDLFYKSAPLHDIGKVGIPDSILLKPGKLTESEFDIMKQHTILGKEALEKAAKNLRSNNFLTIAQEIACSHHERWDGTGYPFGLAGDDIPFSGRLMAIADVYDALISKRVYKDAFSHDKAKSILIEGRGTHFDPDVLDAFLAIEEEFTAIAAR
ncbi:MAG: HD domain-containing protein, partial [Desulfobacterales bacterium]|nr:HD domain-containing protein [Desulfobacterales bacterium]